MITEPVPPTVFIKFFTDLFGSKLLFDAGDFLGLISGLNVVGPDVIASVAGTEGSIWANTDRYIYPNLDPTTRYISITSTFVPPDWVFKLGNVTTEIVGNIVFDDTDPNHNKIRFPEAGLFSIYWKVSASWTDFGAYPSGIIGSGLVANIYSSLDALKLITGRGYFSMAEDGVKSVSLNTSEICASLDAGDYISLTVLPYNKLGASQFPAPIPDYVSANVIILELTKFKND